MSSENDGAIIILSSPSGAGKTTLVKKLSSIENFEISISYTTRIPRLNEVNGNDYYFVNTKDFNELIKKNELLEYAEVFSQCDHLLAECVESVSRRDNFTEASKVLLFGSDDDQCSVILDDVQKCFEILVRFDFTTAQKSLLRTLKVDTLSPRLDQSWHPRRGRHFQVAYWFE